MYARTGVATGAGCGSGGFTGCSSGFSTTWRLGCGGAAVVVDGTVAVGAATEDVVAGTPLLVVSSGALLAVTGAEETTSTFACGLTGGASVVCAATVFFGGVFGRQQREQLQQTNEELEEKAELLSREHFTVDGTLLEAWASYKSFKPRDGQSDQTPPDDPGNPTVDFHGEKRSNTTHQSTTDPDARLYKKGKGRPAQLSYLGHVLMENRHGMVVDTEVTPADGFGERDAACRMVERIAGDRRVTVGADKAYDMREVVETFRAMHVTPHVAQYAATPHRGSAIDRRTTRHAGYGVSQRIRKRVEEIFGWMKTVGLLRKLRHRGGPRVDWVFTFTAAAFNLVRMRTLALRPA
jgi:hypothetical protein